MDAPANDSVDRLDGTQTRGMKGVPYDWERLLTPGEVDLFGALSGETSDCGFPTDDEFDVALRRLTSSISLTDPAKS